MKLILEIKMLYLLFSMGMEVFSKNNLGLEVSKYVEKIFISQLKNSKLYKDGRYE
jgi:hypothetical protein